MATVRQWNKMSSQSSKSANESFAKEIAEKKDTVLSSLASCKGETGIINNNYSEISLLWAPLGLAYM